MSSVFWEMWNENQGGNQWKSVGKPKKQKNQRWN